MTSEPQPAPAPASELGGLLGRFLLWLLLALTIFNFPRYPTADLDDSWRIALGWFFQHHLQFGRDVIFTYGPLGFLMGNTYGGALFGWMVAWTAVKSAIFAAVIVAQGRKLRGVSQVVYFVFFLLLGVIYEDALQMIIIALLGWELVRRAGGPARRSTPLILLFLALLAIIKFTNLLLATLAVAVAAGLEARRQPRAALRPAAWYLGGFLALWVLCRQNPLHLPAFLWYSWEFSQGYQASMGLPTPPVPFREGVIVLGALIAYTVLYWRLQADKVRGLAHAAVLGAFIYLNWKHGFVRSDGHMIGFFICALVPVTGFPVLMEDAPRWRWLQRLLLVPAGILCVLGVRDALPGVVESAAAQLQGNLVSRISNLTHWSAYRRTYDVRLQEQKTQVALPRVRAAVGQATVDVLGFEQGVALFNGLNYHPRPVFQSYAAFTPGLARLNADFYASARAPEYALLKIQTVDDRLPSLDDAPLLYLFEHDYEYVLSEKGWQLWRRRADRPDPATLQPRRLRTVAAALGVACPLDDLADQHVWAVIDVTPSLLGRLRDFLYKPAFVRLNVELTDGKRQSFRLPVPEGRTGFILNPLVTDLDSYMRFAGGKSLNWVRSITVDVAPGDRSFYRRRVRIGFFALTPSTAGAAFFESAAQAQFWMFKTAPASFTSFTTPSEIEISGEKAIVMHAPSEMSFVLPPGAREVSGAFGLPPGAYENGGHSDGAEFRVVWTDGITRTVVYSRILNPRDVPADRGLQRFTVPLTNLAGGQLRLEVGPGPHNDNGWDWSAWTDIEIK